MPTWNPRANDVFLQAIALATTDERQEYVKQACAEDAALQAQVEALLDASDKAGSFLRSPAPLMGATIDAPTPAERLGTMIGPYKLLQQIGEGGMGTVFMAEQMEPVKRKVALKLIKPGMDSRQVIARFEAERQALAMMDHVNIARVFDGGTIGEPSREGEPSGVSRRVPTDDNTRGLTPFGSPGRPYFVMELVHGVPITKYCDDNHLTPRQRLELFVPVCQAIQHAHQKGIIHRDIKPSNVMVTLYDGKPVPKVIDFGVAKATEQKLTDRTLFTQYGTMVGTLEYMSPEQAEMSALGVDTRSDIYSLGVLLYELLTGSTPLSRKRMKEAAYAEILRMIKEEEPPKPSTRLSDSGEALASISVQRHMEPAKLTKLVKGELDWIVMKTLEKDRNRRYETANAFAADVQRYLADETVQACPPSAGYRFRKFARRNKAAIGVAGMVLFFLVLLGSGAGWALRDREAREREIAQETARKLTLTEEGIRQALDRGTTSRADLHEILKKPGGIQQLLNQPARWELFIRTAQGELAQARRLAVGTEGILDAEWTRALDKLELGLTNDQADFDLARRLENIRIDQTTWVGSGFSYRKSAEDYAEALAGFAVLTDGSVAAARLASSPIKDQLVACLDDWARVEYFLRKQDLAEQLLAVSRQAAPDPVWGDRLRQLKVWHQQESLSKLVAEAPVAGLSPQLLDLVGALLLNANPSKEPWQRQAQAEYPSDFWLNFALASALQKTNPVESAGYYRVALAVRPGNTAAYNNLGRTLEDQQKLPEALAAYRKAIEIDPKHVNAHANLANVLTKQNKLPEAVAVCRKAIEIDPKAVHAHLFLGNALRSQGKIDDALIAYLKVIEIDPKNADAYTNLGITLHEQKRIDEAITNYSKAVEIDPKHAKAHCNLGAALNDLRNADKAISHFRKSIELDPKDATPYFNLGRALMLQGKEDDAIAAYRTAIELDPKIVSSFARFAETLSKKAWYLANRPDLTYRDANRAIEFGKLSVQFAPQSAGSWQRLGCVHYRARNWRASVEALEKSCKLQEGGMGDAFQWLFLAMAHWQLGDKESARKWYDKAIESERVWPEILRRFGTEAEELLGVKEKKN